VKAGNTKEQRTDEFVRPASRSISGSRCSWNPQIDGGRPMAKLMFIAERRPPKVVAGGPRELVPAHFVERPGGKNAASVRMLGRSVIRQGFAHVVESVNRNPIRSSFSLLINACRSATARDQRPQTVHPAAGSGPWTHRQGSGHLTAATLAPKLKPCRCWKGRGGTHRSAWSRRLPALGIVAAFPGGHACRF